MIVQLNPYVPVEVVDCGTRNGKGRAVALLDYSEDHSLLWMVCMDASREFWMVPNEKVRGVENWSLGRCKTQTEPRFEPSFLLLTELLRGISSAMVSTLVKTPTDLEHLQKLSTLWQSLRAPSSGIWRNILFWVEDESTRG